MRVDRGGLYIPMAEHEDDRQARRFLRSLYVVYPVERDVQHFAVEKEDGRERLILCRGGHVALGRQMG